MKAIAWVDHREGQQGAAKRADEGVDRIPDRIDPGDLVGEEFHEGGGSGHPHHPGIGKDLQGLEVLGQGQDVEMHGKAGGQRGQVEPPAREQADAAGDAEDFHDSEMLGHACLSPATRRRGCAGFAGKARLAAIERGIELLPRIKLDPEAVEHHRDLGVLADGHDQVHLLLVAEEG
jgi:hypothetical protein